MNKALLASLLQPSDTAATKKRFTIRIDGQIKTGKTTLALTASKEIAPYKAWSKQNPQEINDVLWIGFEENCLMFAENKGVKVKNFLDWSSPQLTWGVLQQAVRALPQACEEYKKAGVTTIIVDSLSTFDDLLIRDLVTMGGHDSDMARIRAYGQVNEAHMVFFDMLRKTELNIIGLVHLVDEGLFGEQGGNSQIAQAMAKQAAKQIDKNSAATVGGARADFVPAMRPKAAARWARLSDGVLVCFVEDRVVRAGVKEPQYLFTQSPHKGFAAGGRLGLDGPQQPCLYPVLKNLYNLQD